MPRLRAEATGVMVVFESTTNTGLLSLDNRCGVPMTTNSDQISGLKQYNYNET